MNIFLLNIALAVGWAALIGSFTLFHLVLGYAIGFVTLWVVQPLFEKTAYFVRFRRIVELAALFIYELVVSSFRVAWAVILPRSVSRPGIVAMPLDAKTDGEILLISSLISLTPGSLSVDVSEDRSTLYVHVMFIDDVERCKADMKNGLERKVIEALR